MPMTAGPGERRAERILLCSLLVLTIAAVLATALGGCIAAPPSNAVCTIDEECDPGEVCGNDGLCYGNPPAMLLAAEVYPSSDSDLVRTDIASITISPQGDVELQLAEPVTISGRVVFASDQGISVAAKVVFRRPSRIPGGPDVVISADAVPGKFMGELAFTARLTPNLDGETYEVSIYPDDGVIYTPPPGEPTPAELAPPKRIPAITITTDEPDVLFTLGDTPGLKQITGRIVDAADRGVEGLLVRAYGRFLPASRLELASSRAFTDVDGNFAIYVPESWQNEFDIEVKPRPGDPLPTIERRDVFVDDPPPGQFTTVVDIGSIAFPSFADAQLFELPVFGTSTGGGPEAVAGAQVTFRTVLFTDELTTVTYRAEGTVGEDGYAPVQLIPGSLDANRLYIVDVLPLPQTPQGSVWGVQMAVGAQTGGVLGELPDPLPPRIYATGRVLDDLGLPVAGVSVAATPSAFYLYGLGDDLRARAEGFGWPETTTTEDGSFALWIDPWVLGTAAEYDLELRPPEASYLPRHTIERVPFGVTPISHDEIDFSVGDLWLPHASLARGPVTDAAGLPVADAEVRIYAIGDDGSLCATYMFEGCQPPARLLALTESDETGWFRLVLPSP